MPINEPPVDQSFLDQVSACNWQGGTLSDANSSTLKPAIADNKWVLQNASQSGGLWMTQSAFSALKDARARDDGSFIAVTGVHYRLGNADGQAKAVQQ